MLGLAAALLIAGAPAGGGGWWLVVTVRMPTEWRAYVVDRGSIRRAGNLVRVTEGFELEDSLAPEPVRWRKRMEYDCAAGTSRELQRSASATDGPWRQTLGPMSMHARILPGTIAENLMRFVCGGASSAERRLGGRNVRAQALRAIAAQKSRPPAEWRTFP